MRHTIVIADNDRDTIHALAEFLADEALDTVFVDSGQEAKREIARHNPSLVVLGTNFSDIPGLELARWTLSRPSRPGLILLSSRADPLDRTIGLEMGADDYVSKPFFTRELLARIHSLLRRLPPPMPGEDFSLQAKAKTLSAWGYTLNLHSRLVSLPHGATATLSWTEAKVLAALIDHQGVPMTRDMLSRKALGRAWVADERALDQHVASLRRKLHSPPPAKPLIITIRHVGYLVEAE